MTALVDPIKVGIWKELVKFLCHIGRGYFVISTPNNTRGGKHRWKIFFHVVADCTLRNSQRSDQFVAVVYRGKNIIDNFFGRYGRVRSEEHTSELQSRPHLVCRLLLEKKNKMKTRII